MQDFRECPGGEAHADVLMNVGAFVISEQAAAKFLDLSTRSLQRLRLEREGPVFVKLGKRRVGYVIADLQAWVRARSVTSPGQ